MRIMVDQIDFADPGDPALLTALDASLKILAEENAVIAEVVNLRFFAGLSIEQTASALDMSVRTVNRHWAYAKAWLYSELSEGRGG